MDIPDIRIIKEDSDAGIVWFEVEALKIRGIAFRESGEHESHYEMRGVKEATTMSPRIEFSNNEVGELSVIGSVNQILEDGVFVVEVHGFDFWVTPDEYSGEVSIGQYFDLQITKFTLYI